MNPQHQQLFANIAGKSYAVTHFMCGNEAISTHFQGATRLMSQKPLKNLMHQPIRLQIGQHRFLHGMITGIQRYGQKASAYHYEILFESLLTNLQTRHNKNFVNQTVEQILTYLLRPAALKQVQTTLNNLHNSIRYLAQYQQTNLEMLEQFLFQQNAFYVWQHSTTQATLYLLDHNPTLNTYFPTLALKDKPFNTGFHNEPVVFEKSITIHESGKKQYYFKTTCADCQPGQLLQVLCDSGFDYNKSFRIIRIEHKAEQIPDTLQQTQHQLLYQNRLTCVEHHDVLTKPAETPAQTQTLLANTVAKHQQTLDTNGDYWLAFHYDKHTTTNPINRIQDVNGNRTAGMHFPLPKASLVLTGFIEDNINQPVILGQIPSDKQPTPVTQHNPYQHQIALNEKTRIFFDDKAKSIQCQQAGNHFLCYPKGSVLSSAEGAVRLHSAGNYQADIGQDYQWMAHTDIIHHLNDSAYLATQRGNVTLRATTTISLSAKQHWHHQSKQLSFFAKQTVRCINQSQTWKAKEYVTLLALETVQLSADTLWLHADKHCQLSKDWQLQPTQLSFKGNALNLIADNIIIRNHSQF